VPIGGALFATAIILKTWHPRAVGTALITSSLAVAVASPITHEATPLDWPDPRLSYLLAAFAVVLAPFALGVGLAFNRIMALARPAKVMKSSVLIPAIAAAGLVIGICSIRYPELPGNGKSILAVSLNSGLTLGGAVVILLLKPLLTAVYLRAGAVGGMLTPALATGAAMGSVVALAINSWTEHHVSVPAVSLTCAAGVLATTQRAPIWAAIFVWELARPPWWLLVPFVVASIAAHSLQLAIENRRAADV
jgi:H+/Cl- antiporter ClcA